MGENHVKKSGGMSFQEKLRTLARSFNKSKAGMEVGLGKTTISNYIASGAVPRGDIAVKIARAVGVPVEWLCDDTQGFPPPSTLGGKSLDFTALNCIACGIGFAAPKSLLTNLREHGGNLYCPCGHVNGFEAQGDDAPKNDSTQADNPAGDDSQLLPGTFGYYAQFALPEDEHRMRISQPQERNA